MNAVATEQLDTHPPVRAGWAVLAGLLALYVPTYLDLFETFWRTGRSVQGPVILAWVAWVLWRDRAYLGCSPRAGVRPRPSRSSSSVCSVMRSGVRRRSFSSSSLSQIPVLIGVGWMLLGRRALRTLIFPIAFTVFVIPVPGTLLDQLLLPLKQLVSAIVDNGLHAVGYPIARNGVVLMIGQYDLLIADACSGLNSMVALSGWASSIPMS